MGQIALYGRHAGGRVALVDDEDHARVAGVRWYRTKTGYAWGRVGERMALLHRHLLGAAPGLVLDHTNGDRLDCRRANLRHATPGQNKANSRRRADARVPYKGIERTRSGRYRAVLTVGGLARRSSTYADPAVAARVYDEMSRHEWGVFARTNFAPVQTSARAVWGRGGSVPPPGARPPARPNGVAEIKTN